MRIEGAPRYSLSHYYKLPQQSWSWVATLKVLGRFLICQRHLYLPLNFLFFFCRSCSLVAVCSCSLVAFWQFFPLSQTLMVYDWMWIIDSSCHHVASIWRGLLQLKLIGWKRVHRIFQTSVWYPAFPLSQSETSLFFPIAKYAWKCHMLVSSTYQLPYGAVNVSTIRSSVSRCFFCVCWDMLLREI